MATYTLTLSDGGFDPAFSGDLNDFKDEIIANISASITSSDVLFGRVGNPMPPVDGTWTFPWLDNGVWKRYSGGTFVPVTLKVGDATHTTVLGGIPTADRNILFPDKSGTVALTTDVYSRPTTVLTGTTPVVDWSTSDNFYELLTANTTFDVGGATSFSLPGQTITIATARSSNVTPTFTGVSWTGGTQPASVYTSGTTTDLWGFKNIAGTIYGTLLAANLS